LRADRPAAAHRDWHHGLVAAEVPVSFRKILALLVLVAALGTYLYVYELPQAQKEGKKDKRVPLDKDAATGISLVFPDRQNDLRPQGRRAEDLLDRLDAPLRPRQAGEGPARQAAPRLPGR